jgi:hypothetical protein
VQRNPRAREIYHSVRHYHSRYWTERNDINARDLAPAARTRERTREASVYACASALALAQGQDDSCIRLIIFFYDRRYCHAAKRTVPRIRARRDFSRLLLSSYISPPPHPTSLPSPPRDCGRRGFRRSRNTFSPGDPDIVRPSRTGSAASRRERKRGKDSRAHFNKRYRLYEMREYAAKGSSPKRSRINAARERFVHVDWSTRLPALSVKRLRKMTLRVFLARTWNHLACEIERDRKRERERERGGDGSRVDARLCTLLVCSSARSCNV